MSTCQPRDGATTRQVPNSAESSKACSPSSRASALATAAGIAGDGEVEVGDLAAERRVADRPAGDPDALLPAERPDRRRPGAARRGVRRRGSRRPRVTRGTRGEIAQVTS